MSVFGLDRGWCGGKMATQQPTPQDENDKVGGRSR